MRVEEAVMNKFVTMYIVHEHSLMQRDCQPDQSTTISRRFVLCVRMFDSVVVVKQSEKPKVFCSTEIELELRWKVLNVP